jgi:FHS family glucose/mannose:H+ symporter-like MFS transporter
MQSNARNCSGRTLAVLHPAFALTGILQAIGGSLLPSLASTFHLNDSQSGLLFLLYFAGTSLGAFFCRGNYARSIALGFVAMAACCLGIAVANLPFLLPLFLLLGISVGVPMSGVSLYAGRNFGDRRAPLLTFLNFSWSAGALAAPLFAAQVLLHHSYRAAYVVLAMASAVAALACWLLIRDAPETASPMTRAQAFPNLKLIIVFAIAAFLQVGVENTAAAWLTTYALRMARDGVVLAAASSSVYWVGFLSSRGISSFVLLRADPVRVFRVAVAVALLAAVLLAGLPSVAGRTAAMFVLGASLAPIYPLVISGFFARARHTSDSRWVLATAGFGGSVLPWLAGWISTHSGSLRVGILTIPAAMLLMIFVLPAMRSARPAVAGG